MTDMDSPQSVEADSWRLFTTAHVWAAFHERPQLARAGQLHTELLAVVRAAAQQLNTRPTTAGANYTERHFLDGRYRQAPGADTQYVVHFASQAGPGRVETVHLTRHVGPLVADADDADDGYDRAQLVHVIVPYYRRPDAFAAFAAMVTRLVLDGRQNLRLIVVFYWRGLPAAPHHQVVEDRRRVAAALAALNLRAGRAVALLLDETRQFSRGHALLRGARACSADDDALLFFCDVDMSFGSRALHRCRANATPGRRVYYPIVFSMFRPRLIARASRRRPASLWTEQPISGELGYWRHSGCGMTCQYKSDFDRVAGGYLVSDHWGGEDVQLFRRHRRSGIEIVRAPDPSLVHIYHRKTCDRRQLGSKYDDCMASLLRSEASTRTWARFVQRLKALAGRPAAVVELLKELDTDVDGQGDVTPLPALVTPRG